MDALPVLGRYRPFGFSRLDIYKEFMLRTNASENRQILGSLPIPFGTIDLILL